MKKVILVLLLFGMALKVPAQSWSTLIDPSRAIDWTSAGFTPPSYTTNCTTQPSLLTGSGNAAANATSIQTALASCDATHNVVNLPAGTYYVSSFNYGSQGKQVLRGVGPMSTYLYLTGEISMMSGSPIYNGNPAALPPSGSQQCSWTGGYAQGTTTITLSSCGGTPPSGRMYILDQANDTSDTEGIYICDTTAANCTYKGIGGGNNDGRVISGVTHSEQQVTYVTGVTSLGGGSYSVTISPGLYFSNIRSSQSPGVWWSGFVQNNGLENVTLDGTNSADYMLQMYDCYQCWVKNIRSINGARAHILLDQSAEDVVRDSYFYQSQSHSSVSYVVESEEASGFLIENNIFQQVTNPLMYGQGSGSVAGYNFSIDDLYTTPDDFATGSYISHNAGNEMNLWEGNSFLGGWVDDAWGSSTQSTFFRNIFTGWQSGKTQATIPVLIRSWSRAYNVIGNVLGQPGYHNVYQVYATSGSGGVGGGNESTTIYSLGWADSGAACGSPSCDALTYSTMMRWGNYDTVNNTVQWNSAEASPAAVPYMNANFTSSYFSSLSHTLPASLYYSSTPSWWPSGKAWPLIGPDISTGNIGECSGGTYAGAQATNSSQCTGGTLTAAWGSHVNSTPAQDCYLNVMGGPPDGSGNVLSFDANKCYAASVGPQTLVTSPTIIANGSTNQTINLTCASCIGWTAGTPGYPTFAVSGGTLVSQTVTSPTQATVVVTPSATNGYLYITAPRTSGVSSPALGLVTVQATFAAGQPFIVNGTSGDVVALTGIGAAWNSTAPTFSISGCGTATKTAQAILSDTTATITINAGSTDCTITITDSSTSNTTTLAVYTRVHYYVDSAIGGTRYSTNVTSGQCNGKADAAYPGSGTNQNCAFSDLRYMIQDGSSGSSTSFPAYGWLMKGGDELTIVGSIAGGVSYRMGWSTSGGCGSSYPYFGLCGDAQDSGFPSIPSGTASQNTLIQGGNAGACTAQSARTQIHGGWGMDALFRFATQMKYITAPVSNSDFITLSCIDGTDFATGKTGGDYALYGVDISLPAHDITFTDTRWHGFAADGWLGTAGGTLTANDIAWAGNKLSGWDADQGIGVTGFGVQTITNYLIEGNGCDEEYPIVDAMPYTACHDDSSGYYGDGFGTSSINSPPPGWTLTFNQGTADYNTQEAIDALHLAGAGSSSSVSRTNAYGNMGNQIKIGGGGSFVNNLITGNCKAMDAAIPGFPTGYNGVGGPLTGAVKNNSGATGTGYVVGDVLTPVLAGTSGTTITVATVTSGVPQTFTVSSGGTGWVNQTGVPTTGGTGTGATFTSQVSLSDFCRAGNTAVVIEVPPATTSYIQFNTFYSEGAVTLEIEPYDALYGASWVGTEALQYADNAQLNFSLSTPIYNESNNSLAPLTNPGGSWTHNLTYLGHSWTCPATGETNGLCVDPGLVDETWHSYGYASAAPTSGSSAVSGAGIAISGITTDFTGFTRPNPPADGGFEFQTGLLPTNSFSGFAVNPGMSFH